MTPTPTAPELLAEIEATVERLREWLQAADEYAANELDSPHQDDGLAEFGRDDVRATLAFVATLQSNLATHSEREARLEATLLRIASMNNPIESIAYMRAVASQDLNEEPSK